MAGEIEAQAAAATIRLEEMKVEYANNPDQRIARDREQLARLESDPYHVNKQLTSEAARQDVSAIKSRIAVAESEREAAIASQVLSDAQRVDAVLAGQDFSGPSATVDGQVPPSDFASVIKDDLALGIPPTLAKAFYGSGLSDDRLGHVYGREWLNHYATNPEWQQLHAQGDPVISMRYRAANMYIAGRHPNVSREEEMAVLAKIRATGW